MCPREPSHLKPNHTPLTRSSDNLPLPLPLQGVFSCISIACNSHSGLLLCKHSLASRLNLFIREIWHLGYRRPITIVGSYTSFIHQILLAAKRRKRLIVSWSEKTDRLMVRHWEEIEKELRRDQEQIKKGLRSNWGSFR